MNHDDLLPELAAELQRTMRLLSLAEQNLSPAVFRQLADDVFQTRYTVRWNVRLQTPDTSPSQCVTLRLGGEDEDGREDQDV